MEIVQGLHQLKTPMTSPALPYVMPYVFEGPDGITLFDAGFGTPEAIASLTAQLAVLGYEPKHIQRLIISHAHPDHLGMSAWIREQAPDSSLVMLEREWQWITDRWLDNDTWTQLSDQWLVLHGVPQAEIEEAQTAGGATPAARRPPLRFDIEPDVKLRDGEVLEFDRWRIQAVWTPGHTPGHLCAYELNHRLMFTGDHVLPHISPNVSLHADQEGTSPLSDFRDSLRKVAAFDVDRALPAHEFTIPDLAGRCAVLLHHHDERLDEVRHAIGPDVATAREISQRVKWNTGPFDDFNIFMKRSALGETLSHLRLLQDEERVRRIEGDGRVHWARV